MGLESYIYEEDCGKKSETCMKGHVYNYGADTCIKYEVDMGSHSKYTGTYYVKCQGVNCCKGDRPDVKQWDIGQSARSVITHLEATDVEDLDGPVSQADTWQEDISIFGANIGYTYYIHQSGDDVISHRIDYTAPGTSPGSILFGNFTVKHADELDAFREVFQAPEECLKPNTLSCNGEDMEKWDSQFFRHASVGKQVAVAV